MEIDSGSDSNIEVTGYWPISVLLTYLNKQIPGSILSWMIVCDLNRIESILVILVTLSVFQLFTWSIGN